jgi:hypothetical protein
VIHQPHQLLMDPSIHIRQPQGMRIPRIIHRPHHMPLVGNGLEQVDALGRLAA